VDFELTSEQELIRASAREFCDREIAPFARDWDRAEEMDRGIVSRLASVGYLGASLPEAYGGLGLDTVSYALIGEELGRADSSVRGIVSSATASSARPWPASAPTSRSSSGCRCCAPERRSAATR
jgi:alkylation response protein AidB-like acyl-CoA dehydrogenase